jgi:tryptophan 2,3-dioxygenase
MKMLARIARIQEQLTQSWAVLATMTPADYLKFRDKLGQSSGFQSLAVSLSGIPFGQQERGAGARVRQRA